MLLLVNPNLWLIHVKCFPMYLLGILWLLWLYFCVWKSNLMSKKWQFFANFQAWNTHFRLLNILNNFLVLKWYFDPEWSILPKVPSFSHPWCNICFRYRKNFSLRNKSFLQFLAKTSYLAFQRLISNSWFSCDKFTKSLKAIKQYFLHTILSCILVV